MAGRDAKKAMKHLALMLTEKWERTAPRSEGGTLCGQDFMPKGFKAGKTMSGLGARGLAPTRYAGGALRYAHAPRRQEGFAGLTELSYTLETQWNVSRPGTTSGSKLLALLSPQRPGGRCEWIGGDGADEKWREWPRGSHQIKRLKGSWLIIDGQQDERCSPVPACCEGSGRFNKI
ncbi:hypothetical protein THAOC_23095 [Thalassiosira oceanica]|uniref:Uncharacterized protein n=1 Tax=Thalassiosira oceanica TaxID=159749 RepID=K0RWS8_THAOC|nr:hypothetical protein THAOC_23095 [Thalassiosira oceanica]|eukprot:EJK56924.1 hypothetical protein THAOC_23095 [Thalassiosira oceanica]